MRPIKMFGLAAVAAVAAMAFVGASSASANTWTSLCDVHTSLVCPAGHLLELFTFLLTKEGAEGKGGESAILKTSIATVLCLSSKGTVHVEEGKPLLDNPLKLLVLLAFKNCGTNAEHNNCTVTVLKNPLVTLLKTALNLGTATVSKELPAEVNVKCGFLINCTYSEPLEGKSIAVEGGEHVAGSGNGMLTANELELKTIGGGFCPEKSKWNALYEPLKPVYILE